MISVVIPTLNADKRLAMVLASLVPAVVHGCVREVIIVDGGSSNGVSAEMAEGAGARFIEAPRGRGTQLAAGARAAKGSWLLFLHDDSVLERGWEEEVGSFLERISEGQRSVSAGAFCFALDDQGMMPRLLEWIVALRCFVFALPYGDQGLLIPSKLYRELGGYREIPLMEDVDLVRRVGRRRLALFRSHAVTSAVRYRADGYVLRMLRNFCCLTLYYLQVPPRLILRLYG